jgi:hypothetical protein
MKDLISDRESNMIKNMRVSVKMLPIHRNKEAKVMRREILGKPVVNDVSYRQGYAAAIEYVLGRMDY